MLSPVSSSLASLLPLPAAPEAPPGAGRPRASTPRTLARSAAASPGGAPASAADPATGTARSSRAPAQSGASSAGYAQATASTSKASGSTSKARSTTSRKAGPLDFLDDPKLSVEEKLLRLLAHLNDRWNKDLDKKMKELKGTEKTTSGGSSGGSSARSGASGLLKKAVGFVSVAMPALGVTLEALKIPAVRSALSSLAGPALAAAATALGQPALAPVALKLGPTLVDLAAGAASSLDEAGGKEGGGPAASTPRTTTKETANALGSDRDAQLKLMEIQRILDQQKEMFSLVSNLLRTTHETRLALIQNVR